MTTRFEHSSLENDRRPTYKAMRDGSTHPSHALARQRTGAVPSLRRAVTQPPRAPQIRLLEAKALRAARAAQRAESWAELKAQGPPAARVGARVGCEESEWARRPGPMGRGRGARAARGAAMSGAAGANPVRPAGGRAGLAGERVARGSGGGPPDEARGSNWGHAWRSDWIASRLGLSRGCLRAEADEAHAAAVEARGAAEELQAQVPCISIRNRICSILYYVI
jgi:hypothetical protein